MKFALSLIFSALMVPFVNYMSVIGGFPPGSSLQEWQPERKLCLQKYRLQAGGSYSISWNSGAMMTGVSILVNRSKLMGCQNRPESRIFFAEEASEQVDLSKYAQNSTDSSLILAFKPSTEIAVIYPQPDSNLCTRRSKLLEFTRL